MITGGTNGYDDIHPGMPVAVEDQNHQVLASTSLPSTSYDNNGDGVGCVWTMKVQGPSDRTEYGVTAGRRGTVTFSREDLVKNEWTAEVSPGSGAH